MVSGTLALKNGYYYAVLSYQDAAGKRHQKWVSTGLPQKGNNRQSTSKPRMIAHGFFGKWRSNWLY